MDELITDSGISLDLKQGVPIPLNLSIADFREPDKRQRNFSKEIELPGTAKNQQFFASAFQLTKVAGVFDFNSSAKVNCMYYKNSNLVMPNAVIKLNKVIILDGVITFKVGLYSDFVDIFLALSNRDIRDLNWTSYDHILNNTNIMNTWSSGTGTGYYYPLIERNQRASISGWRNTDMIPYVYLVDLFDKCMKLVGQKYTSTFLSSARAKSILFGYGGGNYVDNSVSPVELNNRKVLLNNGVISWTEIKAVALPSAVVLYNAIYLSDYSWQAGVIPLNLTVTQDISHQFTPSVFTAGKTGSYKITIQGSIRIQYTGSFTYVLGGNRALRYMRNGIPSPAIYNLLQTTSDDTSTINISFNVTLNQGDTIKYVIDGANIQYTANTGASITENITSPTPLVITYTSLDVTVVEGSLVGVGKFLPSMKCSDFVLGVLRLFKIMVSEPDIYGVVTMEPEITFYQGTNVFTDISAEVDESKEIEVRPSANEYAKKLTYLFKQGTETDSMNYFVKWKEYYGDYSFDQPSFFAKGEQKIELPFGTIIPYQLYPNVIAPRFIDIDVNTGLKRTTSGVARIMFRNAMKNGVWQLIGNTHTDHLTTYPCVHHFDDKDNPLFDINFKLVNEVYYNATVVTTHNTFSVYYAPLVQQIISPEGKYVILYRKINSLQVKELDWTKLLMWNGALFILNKIIDFDSEITEVTKIEMIKVIEAHSINKARINIKKIFLPAIASVIKPGLDLVGIDTPVVLSGSNATLTSSNVIIG